MKLFVTYCFFFWLGTCFSQTVPGYKNGSWWIISNGIFHPLPKTYSHLGNFDETYGYAEFIENNRYGIIQKDGVVKFPAIYSSIEPLGAGLFYCSLATSSYIFDASSMKQMFQNVKKVNRLNEHYLKISTNDSTLHLLHKPSRNIFELTDSSQILGSYFNTVLAYEVDDARSIYTEVGDKVMVKLSEFSYNQAFITYKTGDITTLITANINQKFRNSSNIYVFGNYLSYFDGSKSHLVNLETNQEVITSSFEKIEPAYFGGYFVYSNSKIGWMNGEGTVKIPVLYDRIYKSGEEYIVEKGNLKGQYSKAYKLTIPVSFYNYRVKDNWLLTTSILGYQGLYSLHRNTTILEPQYSEIVFDNDLVKAYYSKNIRVMEITGNHHVKQDFILPNAITVKQQRFSPYDPDYRFDKRLLELGWFYEKKEELDSLGNVARYNYKWGLKDATDSILIKTVMNAPTFLVNQSFSLTHAGSLDVKSVTNRMEKVNYSMMRYFSNGKMVSTDQVLELDTNDCASRNYVRLETTKGYRILLPNDSLKKVMYVGSRYGKYVPYCTAKNRFFGEETDTSVLISHFSLNGKWSNGESFQRQLDKMTIRFQSFEEAKWNFLDTNGNDLFAEPFDFVQEFHQNTAIVKKNGKWGVVNSDTMVLPLKFSEIKRVALLSDTVFVAKLSHHGLDFMNEETTILPILNGSVLKSKGELSLVKLANGFAVYRGNQLERNYSTSAILLSEKHYSIREKKAFIIYDNQGKEIGNSDYKPITLFGNSLMIVSDKTKTGLSSISGDTIISPGKYEIESAGNFIVIQTKTSKKVLDVEGRVVVESALDTPLMIDSIGNQIARIANSKVQLVDLKTNEYSKNKLKIAEKVDHFYSGYFFSKSKILSLDTVLVLGKEDSYELFEEGYFVHYIGDSMITVYQHSLDNKVFTCTSKRIRFIGAEFFSYYSNNELVFQSSNYRKTFPSYVTIESKFKNGFCVVKQGNESFFLDQTLTNPFNRTFKQVSNFNGEYATVKTSTGWTILHRSGIQQSYPSFNEITQQGEGLFVAQKKPTYGVFDHHGNELLAPIYEKVHFISKEIIQVVKNGEIGYFRADGTPIFELLEVDQVQR